MKWIINNLDWIVPSLIAAGALGFAVWSAHSAHVSKDEARKSREASERSAAAAEKSAEADAEQAAMARADRQAAEDELRRRPWRFTRTGKGKYEAVNHGGTLYKLEATAPNASIHIEAGRDEWTFENGEGFSIWVIVGGGQDPTVDFSWAESAEPDAERVVQRQRFVFE
jgi:type VI protein secretion system component VasK